MFLRYNFDQKQYKRISQAFVDWNSSKFIGIKMEEKMLKWGDWFLVWSIIDHHQYPGSSKLSFSFLTFFFALINFLIFCNQFQFVYAFFFYLVVRLWSCFLLVSLFPNVMLCNVWLLGKCGKYFEYVFPVLSGLLFGCTCHNSSWWFYHNYLVIIILLFLFRSWIRCRTQIGENNWLSFPFP